MDIKEFKPAFMELISLKLAKNDIQQGVRIRISDKIFLFLIN